MVSRRQQDRAFARARQSLESVDEELTPSGDVSVETEKQEDQNAEEDRQIVEAYMQGAGERVSTIMGHEVRYSVLNIKKEIQAYSLCKSAADTPAYPFALQTAYFALSVISIDNLPFYRSIAADGAEAADRWKNALKYYRPFIEAFWNEYIKLRDEENEKLEQLGK